MFGCLLDTSPHWLGAVGQNVVSVMAVVPTEACPMGANVDLSLINDQLEEYRLL